MIVEDDYDSRKTLRHILESEGYEVLSAWNGQHALDMLARATKQPRLALVDLMMPVMDGWAFIAILAQSGVLANLPVVVQSAFSPGDREPPSGIQALLKKPIDVEALLALVRKHCD